MQKIKNGLLLISISVTLLVFCIVIVSHPNWFFTPGMTNMTFANAVTIVMVLAGIASIIVGGLGAFRLLVGLYTWLIGKLGKARSPVLVEAEVVEAQAEGVWPPAPRPSDAP